MHKTWFLFQFDWLLQTQQQKLKKCGCKAFQFFVKPQTHFSAQRKQAPGINVDMQSHTFENNCHGCKIKKGPEVMGGRYLMCSDATVSVR